MTIHNTGRFPCWSFTSLCLLINTWFRIIRFCQGLLCLVASSSAFFGLLLVSSVVGFSIGFRISTTFARSLPWLLYLIFFNCVNFGRFNVLYTAFQRANLWLCFRKPVTIHTLWKNPCLEATWQHQTYKERMEAFMDNKRIGLYPTEFSTQCRISLVLHWLP